MKKTALVLSVLLLMLAGGASADTGTYRIADYGVTLTPHASGAVTIEYYQKWAVTGGHIPWITVGVPNSNFTVRESRGTVRRVSNASSGGWAGVRLDLDKDYQPGQSFEVRVTIEQSGLFYADGTNYRLDFTPGWYDNAATDRLTVKINVAAKMSEVRASPTPTKTAGQEISWEWTDLGPGRRVSVSIAFPKTYLPELAAGNLKGHGTESKPPIGFIIAMIVAVLLFILMMMLARVVPRRKGHYSGWSVFWGALGGDLGGGGSRSSGGGGGFGGSSFSCACACVSCACACACAGGGGAGCSRKAHHSCEFCKGRREEVAGAGKNGDPARPAARGL